MPEQSTTGKVAILLAGATVVATALAYAFRAPAGKQLNTLATSNTSVSVSTPQVFSTFPGSPTASESLAISRTPTTANSPASSRTPTTGAFPGTSNAVGFLPRHRTRALPATAAWQPYEKFIAFIQDPSDPVAYRTLVDATEDDPETVHMTAAAIKAVEALDDDEVGHVYSTFMFLAQKYIYCIPEDLRHHVPAFIGQPWMAAAERRGSPLGITYDALIIANWCMRDETLPPTIDNVDGLLSVNGTEPERAFFRVHVAIEAAGGDLPDRMLTLSSEIAELSDETERVAKLQQFLDDAYVRMQIVTMLIGKMWTQISRDTYWKQVRVTLMGSPETAFPNGVRINGTDTLLFRKGGSGAQSPLMHALDHFFGVEHVDADADLSTLSDRQIAALRTLETPPDHALRFMREQKEFMCTQHRRFHEQLELVPTSRQLVVRYGDATCVERFNQCIEQLERWRKVHQNMVHKYISVPTSDKPVNATDGGLHIVGAGTGAQLSNYQTLFAHLLRETQLTRLAALWAPTLKPKRAVPS